MPSIIIWLIVAISFFCGYMAAILVWFIRDRIKYRRECREDYESYCELEDEEPMLADATEAAEVLGKERACEAFFETQVGIDKEGEPVFSDCCVVCGMTKAAHLK